MSNLKNEIKHAEMKLEEYEKTTNSLYSYLHQRLTDPDFIITLIIISFATGFLITHSKNVFSLKNLYKLIRKFSVFNYKTFH